MTKNTYKQHVRTKKGVAEQRALKQKLYEAKE